MFGFEGSEEASEGSSLGQRSRLGVLGPNTSREKRKREGGVEKRGNVSKVAVEVELLPGASGPVEVAALFYCLDELISLPP